MISMVPDTILLMSEPMKATLCRGDEDDISAGVGTWMKLHDLGLIDGDLNTTSLGRAVRDELNKRFEPLPTR